MGRFALAVAWGAFVLCSMIGWGSLVVRGILGVRHIAHWSRTACVGLAFSACVGGALDLSGVISQALVIGFLAAGGAAFIYARLGWSSTASGDADHLRGSWRLAMPLLAIAAALLALRVGGSIVVLQPPHGMQPGSFNTFDDFQAYIAYPLKMLQTGTMGSEPFSLRRTSTHSFGANAFLQTFILAALPAENLRLLDVGLGTVLMAGLLWSYAARMGLTAVAAASVILVFLLIPPPLVNTTSVVMPTVLFISLCWVFADARRELSRLQRAALIGLHVAAICTLKTNLMPAALTFPGVHAVLVAWQSRGASRREAVIDGAAWFAAVGIALLPWLLDAYRWTGTFVPTSLAVHHADPYRVAAFRAVTGWRFLRGHLAELPRVPYAFLALLGGAVLTVRSRARAPNALWSLIAAAVVGTIAVTVAVAGSVNDTYRFMYAFVMSALLIALVHAIVAASSLRAPLGRGVTLLGVSLAAAVLVQASARQSLVMYQFNLSTLVRAMRGERLVAPGLAAKYNSLQQALPSGAVLLEHMDYPFLFDFRRNTILIDDLPGSASPSPGQPFFAGGEALASYLVSSGVRYVAYDYASETGLPRKGALEAMANDDRHPSAKAVIRLTFDFHDNLLELGRTRQRVFDDGTAFAVDLLARRP